MAAIDSEAIAQAEYDASARTLFIRFISGDWYAYLDVEPDLSARFKAASSKGRFFQDQVRDRYAYRRLDLRSWRP